MQSVILASQSVNRRRLFTALQIPFEVVASNLDETTIIESDALKRTQLLAQAKGKQIAAEHPGSIIISADTYTVSQGKTMEKPKTLDEAKEMLRQLSGNSGVCYSGFYYLDQQNSIEFLTTVRTDVTFREIYPAEIDAFVLKYPVLTWAASYALIDEYTFGLVKYISGSLTGLTHGLPMEHVVPLLKRSGFEPHPVP